MRRISAAFALLASSIAAPARAAPRPCAATGPYVVLTAPHPAPADVDVHAVVERLQQELEVRGIELCAGPPPAPAARAIATIRLGAAQGPAGGGETAIALDIEVRDDLTAKRVGREIDLSTTPSDGRSVVVALAADELLRASWAELSLARVPKTDVPIPPSLRVTPTPEKAAAIELGLRGAASWSTGGLALYGADAVFALPIAGRWSVVFSGGARTSTDLAAADGVAGARGAALALAARLAVTRPARGASLAIDAGPKVHVLELHAHPEAGARATTHVSAALAFEAGPTVRIPLSDTGVSLRVGGTAGAVARGLALLDGSTRVAALNGMTGALDVGLVTP